MMNDQYKDAFVEILIKSRAEELSRQEYLRYCREMKEAYRAGKLIDVEQWKPAPKKPKIKYHYPESRIYLDRPDIQNRGSDRLNSGELTAKNFDSPIRALIKELEEDGNTVEACRVEYESLLAIIQNVNASTHRLLLDVLDIRRGLPEPDHGKR